MRQGFMISTPDIQTFDAISSALILPILHYLLLLLMMMMLCFETNSPFDSMIFLESNKHHLFSDPQ